MWVTTQNSPFLPDEADGRVLFDHKVARMKAGPDDRQVGGIGDIVMVPPVREARARERDRGGPVAEPAPLDGFLAAMRRGAAAPKVKVRVD